MGRIQGETVTSRDVRGRLFRLREEGELAFKKLTFTHENIAGGWLGPLHSLPVTVARWPLFRPHYSQPAKNFVSIYLYICTYVAPQRPVHGTGDNPSQA
jgi:hypothetical protein